MAVRQAGGTQGDQDHRAEQGQDAEAAEEAELLGHGGEDEVGVLLGQEVELALGAQAEAFPQQAARTERDLALQDVIAGAGGVLVGMQEGEDAVALVALHHEHHVRRHGHEGRQGSCGHHPHVEASQDHHRHARQGQEDGRAEIGLLEHQSEGQQDH